jgi:hypothetical protein
MRPGREAQSLAKPGRAQLAGARIGLFLRDWITVSTILLCILLSSPVTLNAWANSTHFMIGQELSMRDSLPEACYLPEFIACANGPDIFADSGPEFAHSDYRFAGILLELAGEDSLKQAYSYACVGHIAADYVVHSQLVWQTGLIHTLREIACSSLIYWAHPELRQSTRIIRVRYAPDMLIQASELFVSRYKEGRILGRAEIYQDARMLGLELLGQAVLVHSPAVGRWAKRYMAGEDWESVYQAAVDSAFHAILNFEAGVLPAFAEQKHFSSPGALLIDLGQRLCDIGYADVNTYIREEFVELEIDFTMTADPASDPDSIIMSDRCLDDNPLISFLNLASSTVERAENQSSITLSPAFPNPFNSETRCVITTQIFVDNISICVVNALGQCVYRLYEGSLSIGSHEFGWSGSDKQGRSVASGVYFIVARGTSDHPLIQKMMLIK